MLNQLAIARIKKQLFAVCSLQKKKKSKKSKSSCSFENDYIMQHENCNTFSPL